MSERATSTATIDSNEAGMRQLLERLAYHGEKGIARTLSCKIKLFGQAAGGGFITAFTAVLKFLLGWFSLRWQIQVFLVSINYVGSFLLMHVLGFKLATKLPSLTAVNWVLRRGSSAAHGLGRIFHSQIAAALGNALAVIPAAIAFHLIYRAFGGHSFLDSASAHHVIESLDGHKGINLYHGFLTGVVLWAASWLAGLLEVWGRSTTAACKSFVLKIAPASSNIFLGFS